MDVPSRPKDVLAQPTRARLFALLAQLRGPVGTDELAGRLALHPNGIRAHLERMQDAGLVRREQQRLTRGRPRDVWSISPDATPGGEPPTGYQELTRWLVQALAGPGVGVRAVEAAGRDIGRRLIAADPDLPPEPQMHSALVALGFQPERENGSGGFAYRLRNCPYREAVRENPPLVCGLHRGITRGLLDVLDARTRIAAFVPEDPETAGCRIALRGPLATAGAAAAEAS